MTIAAAPFTVALDSALAATAAAARITSTTHIGSRCVVRAER
jgi:hypothetical protein